MVNSWYDEPRVHPMYEAEEAEWEREQLEQDRFDEEGPYFWEQEPPSDDDLTEDEWEAIELAKELEIELAIATEAENEL